MQNANFKTMFSTKDILHGKCIKELLNLYLVKSQAKCCSSKKQQTQQLENLVWL